MPQSPDIPADDTQVRVQLILSGRRMGRTFSDLEFVIKDIFASLLTPDRDDDNAPTP